MSLRLYHGGSGLTGQLLEIKPSRSGRAELGVGLYLSNSVERASKYAKGSRRLYEVEVDLSQAQDLRNTYLPTQTVTDWVKKHVARAKQQPILRDISDHNVSGYVSLNVLNNLMVNFETLTPKNSLALNKLLIEGHADYVLDRFGGMANEQVLVVINPAIVKRIEPLSRQALNKEHYEINRIEPVVTRPRWEVVHSHLVRLLRMFEQEAGQMGALRNDEGHLVIIDDEGLLKRYALPEDGYVATDENEHQSHLLSCEPDQWDSDVGNWIGNTAPHNLDLKALSQRIRPFADYYDTSQQRSLNRPKVI